MEERVGEYLPDGGGRGGRGEGGREVEDGREE